MQAASKDERSFAERLRKDPVFFQREVLGSEPWEIQQRAIEAVRDHKTVAVASCHAAGKSFFAADVALWFLYAHCPSVVITTAPTDRQVRGVLWKYIGTKHANAKVPLGGRCLTQELKIDRDWFAWGFTAPDYDPDRFQGFHEKSILVVVDEACGVSDRIYEGIAGVLSGGHARLLLIGNPTDPDTEFGRACSRESVKTIHVSAFDTPNFTEYGITAEDIASGAWEAKVTGPMPFEGLVTPEWVADKWQTWGPESPLYAARVLGRFPQSSEDALIPMRWIESAQGRDLAPVGDERIGVDVARFGMDKTVLMHRRGPVVRRLASYSQGDTMQTTGHVVRALKERPAARANVEEDGLGAGVVDRLAELEARSIGVQVGAGAYDSEHFANRRAELYWGLRERFAAGDIDIDPDDHALAAELAALKWKPDSRGRIMIEKKDETKKRLDRSPDHADALMLSFAEDPHEPGYITSSVGLY